MSWLRTARARTRSWRFAISDSHVVTTQRLAGLLLALWAGSLITICALVAPTLFALLDRRAAGQVAAQLFFSATIIGVVVAIAIIVASRVRLVALPRSTLIATLVGSLAPLSSELVLGPLMQAARTAGDMARFGALHGVSALLFGVACIAALVAFWTFNRPAG